MFNAFNSVTARPFAFAIFQSVSPVATVIVLVVVDVVGAVVVGWVTVGAVTVVLLSVNTCPGTMTSEVSLFSAFSSATLNPLALAIFQSVSPDATVTFPVVVPGVTVGVVGVVGVTVAALFKSSVCPVIIASLVRLFSVFNSDTVKPFAVAIFHKVSPDTTTTLLPVDGVVVGVVTPGVTLAVPLM